MRRRHSDHVCYALKDFTEIANNQFSCMQFHPHRLLLYPRRRARGNEFIHSSVGCGFKWRQLAEYMSDCANVKAVCCLVPLLLFNCVVVIMTALLLWCSRAEHTADR